MPIEITNSLRSASVIRVEGIGTYYANLTSLAADSNEVVSAANIKRINWTTNGNIQIVRNGNNIATLHNAGEIRCDEWGYSIANNNTSNVVITVVTGGTVFLEVSKIATYTTPLTGM
jgi:hypothetical protein